MPQFHFWSASELEAQGHKTQTVSCMLAKDVRDRNMDSYAVIRGRGLGQNLWFRTVHGFKCRQRAP